MELGGTLCENLKQILDSTNCVRQTNGQQIHKLNEWRTCSIIVWCVIRFAFKLKGENLLIPRSSIVYGVIQISYDPNADV